MKSMLSPLLLGFVFLLLLHAAPGTAEETAAAPEDTAMSAKDYEAKVLAAGGKVDFVFGDDRPFEQCHASTCVEAADGTPLTAWFAGTKEKHPDVGIWFSRYVDGAWLAPTRVAKLDETAHWNPVLFRDENGLVNLFFKIGPEIPFWKTYWMRSPDNGVTWSEPAELVAGDKGGRGPVRSAPIILSDGAWLAPASSEYKGWKPFMDRSEDGGKTWTRTADIEIDRKVFPGLGAIQPTLWESEPGKVHALLRTQSGAMGRSDSADGGKTWSAMAKAGLPNNNSGIEALRLEDGRVLLLLNPVAENWGARTPLDLAVSSDNGKTWKTIAHLEDNPDEDSEFSYPSMRHTKDGVLISYTWQRQRVRAWQIPLAAL